MEETSIPGADGIMRKTSDLVEEMLAEAKTSWLVAIAVGFQDDTKFVFSSQRHPLETLNQLVELGGSPIGLLRFDKVNTTIQGSYRPFEEYEKDEWVQKYLAGLLDNSGDIVELSRQMPGFPAAY